MRAKLIRRRGDVAPEKIAAQAAPGIPPSSSEGGSWFFCSRFAKSGY